MTSYLWIKMLLDHPFVLSLVWNRNKCHKSTVTYRANKGEKERQQERRVITWGEG
jgi:hypothetical protein